MSDQLRGAIASAFCDELDSALGRIAHCLEQLSEEQVWWRPRPDMNAIGNLLLHLAGNVRQWVVCAIGAETDDRNRPAEFAAKGGVPKVELLQRLAETVDRAKAAIRAATAEEWSRRRVVQGFDVTGAGAVLNSVAHFRGHTQEIVHQTREVLGEKYRFAWVPQTKEQGANVAPPE
jgi:hypothetical protein